MKLIITILALAIAAQSFAHDHQEDRRRHEPEAEIDLFDITNTLYLSSWTFEEKQAAAQVINDSQEYMQSGNMSVLLNQKINELQKIDQNISLEEAIDLIVDSAKATL
jgi:hypothetical protein